MADYFFSTKALNVGYDGKPLIKDINLGIKKGEIVTLIGPNGSGKSTILKSVTKQLKLIAGVVEIDGEDLNGITSKELAKKLAVMLTERMKTELMTCRDIVATGRYPYTGRLGLLTPEDEAIVDEAMESVMVTEIQNKDFNAISDGQRQRVLLARALCQKPQIIILDEPTSFLDIHHKLGLLSLLRTMAKENDITVIMSLHEIDLAQKISDRVICVKGDYIYKSGTPAEVFNDEMVRNLYGIDKGSYDSLFGSIELPRPAGTPEVLVLSNCGKGIPVYRQLQKENRAFAAAVVYENDMDYAAAKHLAAEIVTEKPFCEISDETYEKTCRLMESCSEIIDAGVVVGPGNRRMEDLLERAKASGKLVKHG